MGMTCRKSALADCRSGVFDGAGWDVTNAASVALVQPQLTRPNRCSFQPPPPNHLTGTLMTRALYLSFLLLGSRHPPPSVQAACRASSDSRRRSVLFCSPKAQNDIRAWAFEQSLFIPGPVKALSRTTRCTVNLTQDPVACWILLHSDTDISSTRQSQVAKGQ